MTDLPPVNRIPHNVDEEPVPPIPVDGFGVYSWSPGRADEQVPSTQVHLCMHIAGMAGTPTIRLKSRRAVDLLIAALQRHRDDVWP